MSLTRAASVQHLDRGPGRLDLPRKSGEIVVLTNGCFDLLHEGHVRFLERCAALGDRLIVGLNSDPSVTRLKGAGRPAVPERQRAEILAAIRWVDDVIIFDRLTAVYLIRAVSPDVYAKGADYDPGAGGQELPEAGAVREVGARLEYIELVAGASTTALINQLRNAPEPAD